MKLHFILTFSTLIVTDEIENVLVITYAEITQEQTINISWDVQNMNNLNLVSYSLTVTDDSGTNVMEKNILASNQMYEEPVDSLLTSTSYEISLSPLDKDDILFGVPAEENICSCDAFSSNCLPTCSSQGKIKTK